MSNKKIHFKQDIIVCSKIVPKGKTLKYKKGSTNFLFYKW